MRPTNRIRFIFQTFSIFVSMLFFFTIIITEAYANEIFKTLIRLALALALTVIFYHISQFY